MNSATFSEQTYNKKLEASVCKADLLRVKETVRLVGSDKKVLDLGASGNYGGETSLRIKEAGNEVWAADISDAFSQYFSDNGIVFNKTDLEGSFPYSDKMFDVVVAGEIIEHLADTDNFIKEIKRVMKDDGFVIISTPNTASLGRRINILRGANAYFEASFSYPPNAAGHLRYFTFDLMQDFLKYHGLSIVYEGSDVVSFPFNLASDFLAKIFPKLGRSIIVKAVKDQ